MFAACAVAFLLSVPAASHTGLTTWASIAAAVTAFTAMALNQFLATRPRFLESAFGGLDRMYHVHRQLGYLAFGLMLFHYFVSPNFRGKVLTTGLNELAGEAGEIGFYGLVTLVGVSLFKRIPWTRIEIPWQLWRQSHRFIGVFFVFIAFHLNFIKRPFDGTALLAGYLNVMAALGVCSFAVTQIRPFLMRKRYRVSEILPLAGATLVRAVPVSSGLSARPGQFAFIGAERAGLREPHPFTIARHGEGNEIGFAIKPLGDFTRRLRDELKVGDTLRVEGGYGRFEAGRGAERQVWIAGGIGITPFLALAQELRSNPQRCVHLFHCVRNTEEAVGDTELAALAQELPNFDFTLHVSKTDGRFTAEGLLARSTVDPGGAELWFCGPAALREAVTGDLKRLGHKPARVRFERFEFR
ncbi:ferredoxin reductase family protein [Roseibium aestuarii]|uniref:Ferric reductase-like transmembrane domain-containing protein n=1 Tax=Roseibium aestuarii TaxID=2600299 RepID=A0ABW4JXE5_9HYPH|nr:ferric reductase-like transmembrane domain-containing protein [Roseibium aestuarii]